uniref:Steroid receptor RNA activator 1 n=1 Tax=Oncorhynchus kisutch TaxID=8019 RepID=A0A8C7JQQ1_ONCKI
MEAKDLYIKPGNQERGWNDPPQFSYGLQTAAQGAPKRTPLNKRVPPPQLTGSPCPVPGDFPSLTAPMTPPTNPLAPPCSMNTPPRPCPVAAPPLAGVMMMATPPPPFPVVEHTDSASSQSENEPDVDDVVTLLNWALTACRHTVKKQVCNDVAKRLKLFEDMWKSGKLSLPVRRRMNGLVQVGVILDVSGEAEVADLSHTAIGQEDVPGRHVPVNALHEDDIGVIHMYVCASACYTT